MSVYSREASVNSNRLTQSEIHLYGSSRLGVMNTAVDMEILATQPGLIPSELLTFTRGNKFFELSNHLVNVLVTISDKKLVIDADNNQVADYYIADVITANGYYPFGMQMPGRKYDSGSWYRYGFNGKENDKEDGIVQYDYGFKIYDPRLSRFKSVDPLCKSYPMLSPFQFASNSPIFYIDIDGMEGGRYSIPGNETLLLPTNAIVSQKFVQTKQRQLMGFDTKVNVQKGQLQSFQIGNELYQANWNINTSEFAGYYSGKKKYVPEVEPNIGIVMTVDAAIGKQCIPLNPPQDITWEMPAIFDYDRALENDMTPDAMTHSVSLDGAGPTYGGSEEATATTILKGKDASVFPYLSTSYGTGAQFPIDLGASVGASKGLVWSLEANQGYQFTRDMIAGPQVSGSFSMVGAIGAKGTLNFSIDLSSQMELTIFFQEPRYKQLQ